MEVQKVFTLGHSVVVCLPKKYLARLNIQSKDYVLIKLNHREITISKLIIAGNTRRRKHHEPEASGGSLPSPGNERS